MIGVLTNATRTKRATVVVLIATITISGIVLNKGFAKEIATSMNLTSHNSNTGRRLGRYGYGDSGNGDSEYEDFGDTEFGDDAQFNAPSKGFRGGDDSNSGDTSSSSYSSPYSESSSSSYSSPYSGSSSGTGSSSSYSSPYSGSSSSGSYGESESSSYSGSSSYGGGSSYGGSSYGGSSYGGGGGPFYSTTTPVEFAKLHKGIVAFVFSTILLMSSMLFTAFHMMERPQGYFASVCRKSVRICMCLYIVIKKTLVVPYRIARHIYTATMGAEEDWEDWKEISDPETMIQLRPGIAGALEREHQRAASQTKTKSVELV